jgi:hypothetical protein
MVDITEALDAPGPLAASLSAGLSNIDRDQTITFTQYNKVVLPLDGYVFWLETANAVCVPGSLHVAIDTEQREDETIAINHAIFTSTQEIQALNDINSTTLFIGVYGNRQFCFSSHGKYYEQANLWHYRGDAVYPALASQLVPIGTDLSTVEPIVSNSLPIWLSLIQYGLIYPSFLVPDNLVPPYIVCHIPPEQTEAIGGAPDWTQGVTYPPFSGGATIAGSAGFWHPTVSQLTKDRVIITLYGFTNQRALSFRDYIFAQSLGEPELFGIMNMPIIRDEKRTQNEINVIAQKKTFELDVNYYQSTVSDIAVRLIAAASMAFTPGA